MGLWQICFWWCVYSLHILLFILLQFFIACRFYGHLFSACIHFSRKKGINNLVGAASSTRKEGHCFWSSLYDSVYFCKLSFYQKNILLWYLHLISSIISGRRLQCRTIKPAVCQAKGQKIHRYCFSWSFRKTHSQRKKTPRDHLRDDKHRRSIRERCSDPYQRMLSTTNRSLNTCHSNASLQSFLVPIRQRNLLKQNEIESLFANVESILPVVCITRTRKVIVLGLF